MSTPQPQMSEPQKTAGYNQGQSPTQAWGPPAMSQPYVVPPRVGMPPKTGHVLVLIGDILIATGAIVLAFSLSTVTIAGQENPNPDQFSVGVGAIFLTVGVLLAGIGFLVRSLGAYMAAVVTAVR